MILQLLIGTWDQTPRCHAENLLGSPGHLYSETLFMNQFSTRANLLQEFISSSEVHLQCCYSVLWGRQVGHPVLRAPKRAKAR